MWSRKLQSLYMTRHSVLPLSLLSSFSTFASIILVMTVSTAIFYALVSREKTVLAAYEIIFSSLGGLLQQHEEEDKVYLLSVENGPSPAGENHHHRGRHPLWDVHYSAIFPTFAQQTMPMGNVFPTSLSGIIELVAVSSSSGRCKISSQIVVPIGCERRRNEWSLYTPTNAVPPNNGYIITNKNGYTHTLSKTLHLDWNGTAFVGAVGETCEGYSFDSKLAKTWCCFNTFFFK